MTLGFILCQPGREGRVPSKERQGTGPLPFLYPPCCFQETRLSRVALPASVLCT